MTATASTGAPDPRDPGPRDPGPHDEVRQATVHEFEPTTGTGAVITDSGVVIPLDPEAFAASPLLTLRVGQRLRVTVTGNPPQVSALTLVTFPA